MYKLNGTDGKEIWNTGNKLNEHGQATDVTIVPGGFMIISLARSMIPGCSGNICHALNGRLTMTDNNGNQMWTKDHGNPSGGLH